MIQKLIENRDKKYTGSLKRYDKIVNYTVECVLGGIETIATIEDTEEIISIGGLPHLDILEEIEWKEEIRWETMF